jgi:Phage integrase family
VRPVASRGCGDCGGADVVADQLGEPYRPEWFSDRFRDLSKAAGLPIIRLHDARHTCGTLMHLRGVPAAVISKWLGHATASFTMAAYVHSQDDALAVNVAMYAAAIGQRVSQSVSEIPVKSRTDRSIQTWVNQFLTRRFPLVRAASC